MRLLLLALAGACSDKAADDSPDDSEVTTDDSAADDSATDDSAADDSATDDSAPDDSDEPAGDPGVLMLAGGGSEGDMNDDTAWSWPLYQGLISGGDINGDGLVKVAVLSDTEETDWIPNYFVTLGADSAFNVQIGSRQSAQADRTVQQIESADAVFIKGGDQGIYYDYWNDTAAEQAVIDLWHRGGGVGGTSAGAMSLSQFSLSGSADYVSADVLTDSHTIYLDDVSDPGTSGVHTDFFGLLSGTYVDTHFTERGRLGRMLGVLARAIDDGAPSEIVGIGLEQQTGVLVHGTQLEVHGTGGVWVVRPTTAAIREAGKGLIWTDVQLDVLIDGATIDLDTGLIEAGPHAEEITIALVPGIAADGWSVNGDTPGDAESFSHVAQNDPWTLRAGQNESQLLAAVGFMDAHASDTRGETHELCLRALYEQPGLLCALVGSGGALSAAGGQLSAAAGGGVEMSTLLIDSSGATWRALSPFLSPYDGGDSSLHAAGLVGLRLHAIARSAESGITYDPANRQIVGP